MTNLGVLVRTASVIIAVVVLGVAAILGTAMLSPQPLMFLSAGFLVAAVTATLGALWVMRAIGTRSPRARALPAVAIAVLTIGFALSIAVPSREDGQPAAAVPGQRFWNLPTGSRVRYVKIPAVAPHRSSPVVFVHGGPGTPDMAGDAAYFGRLARAGFDVYVYDELGAGRSERLTHPEGYSRDRDVADLEAVRREIGARRLDLIGHSYGAAVVAGYLAAHPERVARVVLSSPGPLDPADTSTGGVRSRLDAGQSFSLYSRLLRPRNLLVFTLLQVDPDAAHALAGDTEMDAENDLVYRAAEPGLHCAGEHDPTPPAGLGFYRLYYPQSAAAPADEDLRPALAGNATPALVVKGSCDYLSWSSAVSYVDALRAERLVYLRGGHNVYQDAPAAFLAVVRAFLAGQRLPVTPYAGSVAPSGYEGPH